MNLVLRPRTARTCTNTKARWRCLAVTLALAFAGNSALAQPAGHIAADRPPIVRVQVAPQREPAPEPLEERLEREVWFLTKVGDLSVEQWQTLRKEGRAAIERQPGDFQVGGGNQRLVRKRVVVDGRLHLTLVPLDLTQESAFRTGLLMLLKESAPQAVEKIDAQRVRLDAYRKQAAALALAAVFDECLRLSSDQRTQFCKMLALPESDAWWRPKNAPALLDTSTRRLFDAVSGRGLGSFVVPDADLQQLLHVSQWELYKELRQPILEEITIVQTGAGRTVRRRLIRSGQTPHDERSWQLHCLERLVDEVDGACGLSTQQREKLLLAGKFDIEPSLAPPMEQQDAEQGAIVQRLHVRGGVAPVPTSRCDEPSSYFHKTLRSRLDDDQRQRWAEAQRPRRAFQRQALVAAAVVGFERTATLTAEQCTALDKTLNEALTDADDEVAGNGRLELVRRIGVLPDELLRPLFSPVQWRAACRQRNYLTEAARHIERPAVAPLIGAGRIQDPQRGMLEFDALQIDVNQ
jgi:hypothetical protein